MNDMLHPILATDEKSIRNGNISGRSSIMMSGGYFYGDAQSETHVPTQEGTMLMLGDNGIRGPFRQASEAQMSAEGRVSNTLFDGATDKAWMTAVKIHGPSSKEAMRYTPSQVSNIDIEASAAAVDASKARHASVAGVSTDRGVDPLTSFRAMAADGTIPKDDIRQLAAAYTHPDEDQRLPAPATLLRVDDVRLEKEDAVTLAAIRKLERSGSKNRAAEAYEDLGMRVAKIEGGASALPFLINSCNLAREHTREHGRDVRPMRRYAESEAR